MFAAIRSALWGALLTFLMALPILGVKIEQNIDGLKLSPQLWQALLGAAIVFVVLLLLPLIYQPMQTVKRFPRPNVAKFVENQRSAVLFILILVGLALPFFANRSALDIATLALVYVMLGLGLNVVVGYAGLLNLGFVGFYAIGAYTYAILQQYGYGFWTVLPLAGLLAALTGILLGFPVLRLRGDYLAIVTLGFGEIIRLLINNLSSLTGGPNGISSITSPTFFNISFTKKAAEGYTTFHSLMDIPFKSEYRLIFNYLIIFFLCLLTLWIIKRLLSMPIGRAWEALREDEIACRSLGINPTVVKLSAFAIGALFAGLAGAFFAAKQGSIVPEAFTFWESAIVLAIVVLGGMGSQTGVMLAAIAVTVLPELAREFSQYRMLIFGAVMVVMMIWRPQGLIPAQRKKVELTE